MGDVADGASVAAENAAAQRILSQLYGEKMLVDAAAQTFCTGTTVKRFLRAHRGVEEDAKAALIQTLLWRANNRPHRRVCAACAKDPRAHPLRPVGLCKLGRPVVYGSLLGSSLPEGSVMADIDDHIIHLLEWIFSLAGTGAGAVWIVDLHGFCASTVDPLAVQSSILLLTRHYPEVLGALCIVDSPLIFLGTWKALKTQIPPVSLNKVSLVRYRDADAKFQELLPQPVADRVRVEMEDARNPEIMAVKQWWDTPPEPPVRSPGRTIQS
ncbi:Random slug protein 5 [Porphyridium purpureum]|uniref:Random slug protein 5 n=1 Tax=Porphyridium purpureum TaxID=35688 RepID=A0A5J4YNR3_PORPP|nr:Random slug protein 5 [Porphyridium purpureum]|eukprot:POR0333..scf222_8